MGPLPKPRNGITKRQQLDDPKTRHRCADSKYRTKMQFLYLKLRELLDVKNSKDELLSQAAKYIQDMESEITVVVGESGLEAKKDEYLGFLIYDEKLWKREKNPDEWYSEVNKSLITKEYLFDGLEDKDYHDTFWCRSSRRSFKKRNTNSHVRNSVKNSLSLPSNDVSNSYERECESGMALNPTCTYNSIYEQWNFSENNQIPEDGQRFIASEVLPSHSPGYDLSERRQSAIAMGVTPRILHPQMPLDNIQLDRGELSTTQFLSL